MIGLQIPSSSFRWGSNSSFSAVVGVEPANHLITGLTDRHFISFSKLIELCVFRHLFHLVRVRFESILRHDSVTLNCILLGIGLGLSNESFDISLRKSGAVVGNGEIGALTAGFVPGIDLEDPVGIDVIRHLDLRNPTRRWWDTRKLELP